MAQIDKLLEKMVEHKVQRAVIVGDQSVRLVSSTGEITGPKVTKQWLESALQEITPDYQNARLIQNGTFRFTHNSIYGSFQATVERNGDALSVYLAQLSEKTAGQFASPVSGSLPIPASSSLGWYYARGENRLGPVSDIVIADLAKSGAIRRDTLVWQEGMKDWTAAHLTELHGLFSSTPSGPPPLRGLNNDSGTGSSAILPSDLQGFNWGACLTGLFWSIAHNTWIGLLGVVIAFIPAIGGPASLGFWVWMGFKGNEFAWRNRKWDDKQEFRRVQEIWMHWGFGAILAGLFLAIVVLLILGSM
jgi:hypothetical protein